MEASESSTEKLEESNSSSRYRNMIVSKEFEDLAREAASLASDVRTELATFPSGAAMLDVHCGGRMFVLAYSPQWGFGVDEIEEEVVGIGTSFRHGYDNFAAAKDKLLALLATTSGTTAALPPVAAQGDEVRQPHDAS